MEGCSVCGGAGREDGLEGFTQVATHARFFLFFLFSLNTQIFIDLWSDQRC